MSKHTVSAAGAGLPVEGHKPETGDNGFLRLMALRQAIEKTRHEMAALLDDVDAPEGVRYRLPRARAQPSASGGLTTWPWKSNPPDAPRSPCSERRRRWPSYPPPARSRLV